VNPQVRLRVPADAEHLRTVRSVVAALAASAGCTVDALADLRLAVDEAATRLLLDVPAARVLAVEAAVVDDGLEVVVAASTEQATAWPPPELERSLSWAVIAALVREPRTLTTHDGPAIAFRVVSDA
jgi:serine/threonine-protein kinase RsbW